MANSRLRRGQLVAVRDRVLAALRAGSDARSDAGWSLRFLDGTMIQAHPHAAARKRGRD